jgi:hypothetical protein
MMEKLDQRNPRVTDILHKASQDTCQQEERIAAIFGNQEIPKVTDETLAIYFDYLKQHLELPCRLTGIEDMGCFAWEERYRFLPERAEEYAERRKQEPSQGYLERVAEFNRRSSRPLILLFPCPFPFVSIPIPSHTRCPTWSMPPSPA